MNVLNVNVGLLGHVDSGKTSLAKCLSTTSSTACFDKSPQSQERGITIDLGFSSFRTDKIPDKLNDSPWKSLQFTLVDCPGHASLIKTVIGGVQIIDMMILVVDITKGIQTQTAECLIIGELMKKRMIVVLNKIDLVEGSKRSATIEKVTKKMKATLSNTIFKDSPIVAVSARPSGSAEPSGIVELKTLLSDLIDIPRRLSDGVPMLFSVDHCFSIKGKGTIMTGTLLQGTIKVNDEVEVVGTKKKVKSLERFRESVTVGRAGDRLGVCLTQFDPKLLERGLACSPGTLSKMYAAIISLHPIRYHKNAINNKSKYHVTIGYETTLANLTLFTRPAVGTGHSTTSSCTEGGDPAEIFSFDEEYLYKNILEPEEFSTVGNTVLAILEPERPVPVWKGCMLIGSRLDSDLNAPSCRLVFSGNILHSFVEHDYRLRSLPSIKIFKNKEKSGTVHRIVSPDEIIATNLFKKQTDMSLFLNLKVELSTGECGFIESTFGTTGKVKIRIPDGLKNETLQRFNNTDTKNKIKQSSVAVILKFKKYIYDKGKVIHQK